MAEHRGGCVAVAAHLREQEICRPSKGPRAPASAGANHEIARPLETPIKALLIEPFPKTRDTTPDRMFHSLWKTVARRRRKLKFAAAVSACIANQCEDDRSGSFHWSAVR